MNLSSLILPIIILIVLIYSYRKVNIYNTFIEGCSEGFKVVLNIFPNLVAMFLSVNIFINSGILDYIIKIFPFPYEEVMMVLLRPISGNASIGLLNNIYSKYGPDSRVGTLCSIIQSSSETTFYVISLYFGSIGIKNIRYALYECLICDVVGIIISIIITNLLF